MSARSCGLVAALASVVALASLSGCSAGGPEPEGSLGAARLVDGGAAASNVGSPEDAAANADAGRSTDASRPAVAGSLADAGAPRDVAPFHVIGRIDTRDPAGPRLGWPGAEIRAHFAGPALSLVLQDTGASHYDVSLDGGSATLLVVSGSAQSYPVASGLTPGEHEVRLTKRTETFTGVTQLLGFVGTLVPSPAPSGRRMELVGDSITCGFGVLGADETCPFSASTQSEPLAWGALAAKQLGALHMVTAVSGLGVLRNYGGDTTETMPERYDRALANDASSAWNHQAFEPDVIVVSLGTNDFSGGKGDPGPAFEVAYATFLAAVRTRHAKAHIVATTSPMLSNSHRTTLRAYVAGAIAKRQTQGDTFVSLVDLDEQREADGYGCGYHPSSTTQKKMAARLVAHVKPLLGW